MQKLLTAQRLKELLFYDPETGTFTWRVKRGRMAAGYVAGGKPNKYGYARIHIDGLDHHAHRLAWLYMTGTHPSAEIDHINGDGMDNRFANLRCVDRTVNIQNQRAARSDNLSCGLLGVTWAKNVNKWKAGIYINGQHKHLGLFSDPEAAHVAYLGAKRRLHDGCTI